MQFEFTQWTQGRYVPTLGTNAGAEKLPFQTWRNFKEAFAPELVARAITESGVPVRRCLDPFGGSGTTALSCQFLNVEPITIEVNPYLADLIEAKLACYDGAALIRDFSIIYRSVRDSTSSNDLSWLPPTFVEPGVKGRWLFGKEIAQRVELYRLSISQLPNSLHRKFFRAILGGVLVDVSNVTISGKGRRYRKNWESRRLSPEDVDKIFSERVKLAAYEISRYANRTIKSYTIYRDDCRKAITLSPTVDLAVFSPPYPNSFDYTDVYNIELWMLGYLNSSSSNRTLRQATLASHVQIRRNFAPCPKGSLLLDDISSQLHNKKDKLWNRWIPAMVDAYFADMQQVMQDITTRLNARGEIWAVVGDSLYANVHIPVAEILSQLAPACGLEVLRIESFRSMRTSAQQGWQQALAENLIIFRKVE